MSVETKKVGDRRKLRFESLAEVLAEAERLAAATNVRTVGNWSLGQILMHLAIGMNTAIDGTPHKAFWLMRMIAGTMKKKFLNKPMSPGFNLSKKMAADFIPDESVSVEEGIEALRKAVQRMQENPHREPHIVFGKMTSEEWNKLHRRHGELHLSFVVAEES